MLAAALCAAVLSGCSSTGGSRESTAQDYADLARLKEKEAGVAMRTSVHGVDVYKKGDTIYVTSESTSTEEGVPIGALELVERYSSGKASFELFRERQKFLTHNEYFEEKEVYGLFVAALSEMISRIFASEISVKVEHVIVGNDARLRETSKSALRENAFSVRFFHLEGPEYWFKKSRHDLKTVSHEIYHAYDRLRAPVGSAKVEGAFTPYQRYVLEEASARLFSQCVERNTIGKMTVYHADLPDLVQKDGTLRTGSLSDKLLSEALDQEFLSDLTDVQRIGIAEALVWTVWLERFGNRWEIGLQAPAAVAFDQEVCSPDVLGSRRGLVNYLRGLAADGIDAPEFDPETALPLLD